MQNAPAENAAAVGEEEFNVPENVFRDCQLKWNGWGYNHSFFALSANGQIMMHSDEYADLDGQCLPSLRPWIEQNLGVDMAHRTLAVPSQSLRIPPPTVPCPPPFLHALRSRHIPFSSVGMRRLVRSHGQTLAEVFALRMGHVGRIVDLVVWPRSEADVELIVRAADTHNVALIPIGGGTSVSNALNCPQSADKCFCSVDMALMDRISSIDTDNSTCTAEAGILGQTLEKKLNESGFTCGHEPDSMEFSTLGGWISTRASGMKKNKYGNIEDLLLQVTLCTPKGTLQRRGQVLINLVLVIKALLSYPLPYFAIVHLLSDNLFRGVHRGGLFSSCYGTDKKLREWALSLRILLILWTLWMALSVPYLVELMGLIGNITGTVLSFIWPAYFHLKLRGHKASPEQRRFNKIVIVGGVCTCVVGIYYSWAELLHAIRQQSGDDDRGNAR